MIRTALGAVLLLLIALPAPGIAQPAARDSNPAGEEQQDGPAQAASAEDAGSTEDEPAATAAVSEEPGEYRASEQISEDLSVSFPVDI